MKDTHNKGTKNSIRWIYVLDVVILLGSFFVILGMIGYTRPLAIAPEDGFESESTSVLFTFAKAEKILLDDNQEFTSPREIYAENDLIISLEPGTYYWKVVGVDESEVRELTILSYVDLQLRDSGENYEVVNAGNVALDVDIFDQGTLVGNVILDVAEHTNVTGKQFIGGQHE